LTCIYPMVHSLPGSFLSMMYTVRGFLDCLQAKLLWVLPLVLAVWGVQAAYCQEKFETPQQTNDRIQQLANAARPQATDLPIGTGDLIHIDVFDVPDLSRDARVTETGMISLPLIPGKIRAGGLTSFQLEEKLADLLLENGLVSHPQVSVFVKERTSQPVSVVGAVNRPSVFQVYRPTTLLEILAQAGGISGDAGSVIMITRPIPPKDGNDAPGGGVDSPSVTTQTITINLKDLLESGDPAFNIPVYGGDVITVPRAGIVYVVGAVMAPGGFVLQNMGDTMTTFRALALAHGLTSTAKGDEATIVRKDPVTGVNQEIPVHLKKIMARKSDDVRLNANDILVVPDSSGKRALHRAGEITLGVTTGLVILRAGR
jgi:polysaccharide export outer membrane protein